ncbi:ABC transporter, partial [Streptomyces sp. NPDC017868]
MPPPRTATSPPAASDPQPPTRSPQGAITMTTSAIAASGLRKSYGDKTVLDGIDLTVPEGSVF